MVLDTANYNHISRRWCLIDYWNFSNSPNCFENFGYEIIYGWLKVSFCNMNLFILNLLAMKSKRLFFVVTTLVSLYLLLLWRLVVAV